MNTLTVLFGVFSIFGIVTGHYGPFACGGFVGQRCPKGWHCDYPLGGDRNYCHICGGVAGQVCPKGWHCDYPLGGDRGYCHFGKVHVYGTTTAAPGRIIACGTSVRRHCPEGMHCDSLLGDGKIGFCHIGNAHPTPKPTTSPILCGGSTTLRCPSGMHCDLDWREDYKIGTCHPGKVHDPHEADGFPRKSTN